jgi:PKD repeat protein
LFHRSAALYTAAELNGLIAGSTISSIAYTITTAANSTVSGNFKLYAANTTDQSFSRSTTWSTLLSTPTAMKLVYTGPLTITNTTGLLTIPFDSAFVFSGGGLYLAFDWEITSALSTTSPTYACNGTSTLITGQGQRNSQGSAAPSTLSNTSALRPILRIESPLQQNDAEVQIVYSTGQLPVGQQQKVSACIKNSGATELTNYTVSLTVSGVNNFTNQKVISLPSLSAVVVTFDAYTPVNAGTDTIRVSVSADDNNINNSLTNLSSANSTQLNYTLSTTADGSAGFGTAAGIMAVKYQVTDERYVRSIQAFISNSNANVGNRIFGLIMDANGNIIGRTDTILIAALQINQYISLNLTNRVILNNTAFYVGIGQLSNTVSYMPIGIKVENPLRENTFFTSNINALSLQSSTNIGRLMIGCSIEEVTPAAVPNLGANREECAPYTLSAGTTAVSYLWSTGATTSSIVVNSPGIYTVRVDNGQGQINTDTVNLVVSTPFAPQISITKTPDPSLCEGSTLTFRSTTNAGNNKLFKWYVNSVLKQSSAVDSFVSTQIVDNDTVKCIYYSGSLCATSDSIFSNSLIVKTLGSPSVATVDISSSVGLTICSGTSVTFSAITNNGGTAPAYQWFINGNAVTGATGPNFVRNGLGNGSKVSVRMTSNSNCIIGANVKFDTVTMIVNSRPSTGFNATAVGTLGNYSFSNTTTSTLGVSYLWNFGNGATSTATNPTYKYNTPGIYTVKLVATNSCGKDSTSKIISVVIVGIEQERNLAELSIFPNPSEGLISFNLDLVQEDDIQIDIVNVNGQLLHSYDLGTIKQYQNDLDLSWLSAGVYVVNIRGRLSSVQRRVVLR